MKKGTLWTRDEYIVVLNLYYKLPFGKLNRGTKEVKELAALMGRTNNSVAMRLSNFAACDPYIISTGRHGLEAGKVQCQPYWVGCSKFESKSGIKNSVILVHLSC